MSNYTEPVSDVVVNDTTDNNSVKNSVNENNELTKFKNLDKNFYVITRTAPFERKGVVMYKKKKIGVYTSGNVGSKIRNAETGEYYNYTVGSKYEDMFFSVRLSTGECNGKNVPATLFFTSPQHYVSYLHNDVSEDILDIWNYKRDKLIREIKETKNSGSVHVR